MQDKSPPSMSMSRKPDLRTLLPPANKCGNMPAVVSVTVRLPLLIYVLIFHAQRLMTVCVLMLLCSVTTLTLCW